MVNPSKMKEEAIISLFGSPDNRRLTYSEVYDDPFNFLPYGKHAYFQST